MMTIEETADYWRDKYRNARDQRDELQQQLEDYKEGCEGLKLSVSDLRKQRDELLIACKDLIKNLDVALTVVGDKKTCNLHELRKSECIKNIKQAIQKAEEK